MNRELWIVGEHIQRQGNEVAWDFVGVFDTEEAAVAACTTWKHFVAPALLNERLPDDGREEWPGCYYPQAREHATHE